MARRQHERPLALGVHRANHRLAGFVVYSWLLGNWVFVATNVLMPGTVVVGEWILLANQCRSTFLSRRMTDEAVGSTKSVIGFARNRKRGIVVEDSYGSALIE